MNLVTFVLDVEASWNLYIMMSWCKIDEKCSYFNSR